VHPSQKAFSIMHWAQRVEKPSVWATQPDLHAAPSAETTGIQRSDVRDARGVCVCVGVGAHEKEIRAFRRS